MEGKGMSKNKLKRYRWYTTVVTLSLILVIKLLYVQASDHENEIRGGIANIMNTIQQAQGDILALYNKDKKIAQLLREIEQLKATLISLGGTITSQASSQGKLQENALTLWSTVESSAIKKDGQVNVQSILTTIFSSDQVNKEKFAQISRLKRELSNYIIKKGWVASLQQLGKTIEQLAINEIRQVNQALVSVNAIQDQLISQRQVPETNSPELELVKKQLLLQDRISKAPISQQLSLNAYKRELKKILFMLEILQYPSKATAITADSIVNLDLSFTEFLL